jgi:hypothetical protein
VQALSSKNEGYYLSITSAAAGTINATWNLGTTINTISLYIYSGNPLSGQPNPTTLSPPSGALASATGKVTSLTATTPTEPAGTYTVYFWNQGNALNVSSTGTITYVKSQCP